MLISVVNTVENISDVLNRKYPECEIIVKDNVVDTLYVITNIMLL